MQIYMVSPVMAADRNYTIHDGRRMPIPETYTVCRVINSVENGGEEALYLKEPEDLFINSQGYLFIADTGNSRIVKLDKEGNLMGIYNGPADKPLKFPSGVYADDIGNMYIADTGNARILHLSHTGKYVEEFIKPESQLLGENFTFDPSKIYVSPTGFIYVVKGQTILTLDAHNRFRGYVGQSEIGFNLKDLLLRIFASDEQKKVVRKRIAAPYLNITMDKKGMLYATSLDTLEGEIKKLNSVGNNTYRKYGKGKSKIFNFSTIFTKLRLDSTIFAFGERMNDDGNAINPLFIDIDVNEESMVTVVEQQTAKVYQYDPEGNILTVFGGKGDQKGRFNVPAALAGDQEGRIYVLDRVLGNIQVFEPTEFIKKVHHAVTMYSTGKYDEAYEKWKEVLAVDENYQLAHLGIANVLYKQENWEAAMDEYKMADDRIGYSKAYIEYRYEVFRQKFTVVILVLGTFALLAVLYVTSIRRVSEQTLMEFGAKENEKIGTVQGLKMSLGVVFHPVETFEAIKNGRGRLNYIPGFIILFMVLLTRLFNLFVVHYPLADVDIRDSNLLLETVKLLLPVVTWVVASFAVTTILDGESKFGEIFISATYCMIPYILLTIPLSILSRILTREEVTFYAILTNGTWIWILFLFFLSMKILNDYRVFKTAATCTISGITMVLIWLVSLLGYVLTGRIYQFAEGIINEIRMMWM